MVVEISAKWFIHSAIYSAPLFLKIKVLRNLGLFQTLEEFQILHTWFFFQFVTFLYLVKIFGHSFLCWWALSSSCTCKVFISLIPNHNCYVSYYTLLIRSVQLWRLIFENWFKFNQLKLFKGKFFWMHRWVYIIKETKKDQGGIGKSLLQKLFYGIHWLNIPYLVIALGHGIVKEIMNHSQQHIKNLLQTILT